MTMWDAGACAVALAGASLLVNPMLLAKNGVLRKLKHIFLILTKE